MATPLMYALLIKLKKTTPLSKQYKTKNTTHIQAEMRRETDLYRQGIKTKVKS